MVSLDFSLLSLNQTRTGNYRCCLVIVGARRGRYCLEMGFAATNKIRRTKNRMRIFHMCQKREGKYKTSQFLLPRGHMDLIFHGIRKKNATNFLDFSCRKVAAPNARGQ